MVDQHDIVDLSNQADDLGDDSAPVMSTLTDNPTDKDAAVQSIKNVFEFEEFIDRLGYNRATLDALKMVDLQSFGSTSSKYNSVANRAANVSDVSSSVPQLDTLYHIAYNPNEKAKRLGRPRKHLGATDQTSSGDTALRNLETSKLLKFRLDNMPLEGPGSRGGSPDDRKRLGVLTESAATKKRKQSLLNFATTNDHTSVGLQTSFETNKSPSETEPEPLMSEQLSAVVSEVEPPSAAELAGSHPDNEPEIVPESVKSEPALLDVTTASIEVKNQTDEPIEEPERPTKKAVQPHTNGKAKPKETKTRKVTLKFKNKITRTSIVREKNRITRTYPGPLVAVHYDLYDDNLFEAQENSTVAHEPIALGFNVKRNPYLGDVIFIMAFLAKFPEILYVGHIGPQDIEDGLGLSKSPKQTDEGVNEESPGVSPLMDNLFCKLLTLVLNRKKIITPGNYKSGVQDLRSNYIGFGLPEEWRDDAFTRIVSSLPVDSADRVDPSKPAVSEEDNYEYLAPLEKLNPMHEKAFEDYGLAGIPNPVDRLIMMRCLVIWSLSASNVLKAHLALVVNKQEIAGEKDTLYASRPILKGFTQTIDLKKDLEAKLAKKGKTTASPQGTPDPDSTQRYIDPTSDPVVHPMALRLNEFIVGDCGFRIGRFYLVRMADPSGGGLSSVDKMKAVAKDPTGIKLSIPSKFKLYVEDVHSVLLDSLRVFGVEFDKHGNEVHMPPRYDDTKHWHEVASNGAELTAFTKHLAQRLGLANGDSDKFTTVSQNSIAYKPILYMYQYLSLVAPLLESFERMEQSAGSGGSRSAKKKVDYNVSNSSSYANAFEEGYEEHLPDDDDDSYDEGDAADYDDEEYLE